MYLVLFDPILLLITIYFLGKLIAFEIMLYLQNNESLLIATLLVQTTVPCGIYNKL